MAYFIFVKYQCYPSVLAFAFLQEVFYTKKYIKTSIFIFINKQKDVDCKKIFIKQASMTHQPVIDLLIYLNSLMYKKSN